ncbi:response regulator [Legionella gresilensis]|uniref:response regulator n=1 Tax=Legionella gresilensis TaxID=91823 RepID=UPI0010413CFB|nr:response regulator [Legionella gresilensis]
MPIPLCFLVIDTSLATRVVIRAHFNALGYFLDTAWDLESACDRIDTKLYDFIIIDKHLVLCPVVEEFKSNSFLNKETPLIHFSSLTDRQALTFRKPIVKDDLLRMVTYLEKIKM